MEELVNKLEENTHRTEALKPDRAKEQLANTAGPSKEEALEDSDLAEVSGGKASVPSWFKYAKWTKESADKQPPDVDGETPT